MSDKSVTPKQVLLVHINELHRQPPRKRMNYDELGRWHAEQHHRFSPSHVHAGVNLGPGRRPPGWRTGADPVLKG